MSAKLKPEVIRERINKRLEETGYILLNPDYDPTVGISNIVLELFCKKHNHKWPVNAQNFINGTDCNFCGIKKRSISRRKPFENINKEIIKRLEETGYILLNPDFEYVGVENTILQLKCPTDNYEWPTTITNFIKIKTECPMCAGNLPIPLEIIILRVKNRCDVLNYKILEIGEYNGNETKFHIKCLIDDHIWWVSYNSFINTETGCEKCGGSFPIPPNEAIKNVIQMGINKKHFKLRELTEYKNVKTKYKLECTVCGYNEWESTYNKIINSNNECPNCAGNLPLTQEEAFKRVDKRIKETNYILKNPNFIYIGVKETILELYCKKHDYKFPKSYNEFVNSKKECIFCGYEKTADKLSIPIEILIKNVIDVGLNIKNFTMIKMLEYNGNETKFLIKCNKCNYERDSSYSKIVTSEENCPKCAGIIPPTQEEAHEAVRLRNLETGYILLNPDFEYIGCDNTILWLKCPIDGETWPISYYRYIKTDSGCPKCGNKYNKSEGKIEKLLVENNIYFLKHYRDKTSWLKQQELDFYLPDFKIGIEHQGRQHFISVDYFGAEENFLNNCERDLRKFNNARANGVEILYFAYKDTKFIPEDYFTKVYTNEQEFITELKRLIEERKTNFVNKNINI